MTAFWPESQPGERERFDRFKLTIQSRCPDVRFAWIGGKLLVVGTVNAYTLKASIQTEAEAAGLTVQNCVRVVPGRAVPEAVPYRLAG